MRRTLYVSDLDGTLLGRDGQLSGRTRRALELMRSRDILFTAATARTQQAAARLLRGVEPTAPVLLNNGVAFYDFNGERYIKLNPLPVEPGLLAPRFVRAQAAGFLYALRGGALEVYHPPLVHPEDIAYLAERRDYYRGHIHECAHYPGAESVIPLYFVAYGSRPRLAGLEAELNGVPGLRTVFSQNVYRDACFLEVISSQASKALGLKTLRELTGADEVVAFGDNYNDIEMLRAADRSYAPANAVPEAKEAAAGIIGDCGEDGVARFILQDLGILDFAGIF